MHQTIHYGWLWKGALALAVVIGTVSDASAGWGGGSWGGSSGGWGSSGGGSSGGWGSSGGGSSGGYGSHGGGLFRRWHAHKMHRHWGGGSSGGWGSSGGGSSGGYWGGSSGGGGWGSSGGGMYYSPAVGMPEDGGYLVPDKGVPANGATELPGEPMPPTNEGAAKRNADGMLIVEVPADAKIYVNDRLTSTPGEIREYVSRNLARGFNYSYEVRAELERDGKTVTETKRVDVRAGENTRLAFNFAPAAQEVETSITVKVPADAKVKLGGNDTSATGETRTFRTSALRDGAEWKDYKIVVTWEVDGRQLTKEQTFDLKAGDSKELTFDFDTTSVADAR